MDFIIEDGVLRKYKGDEPIVIVSNNVSCIEYSAFKNCKGIKSIVIPQSVMTIEAWAFAECESLESVQILGKPILKEGVFYRCIALRELIAPQGLEKIANGAFIGCRNLKSDLLSKQKFDLYTLTSNRNQDGITYPDDTDICKQSYSWEEYKDITAQILEYALIYSTEEYNELEGPEIPTTTERNIPITDDLVLVKDGKFFGCLLETERVFYGGGRECKKSRAILKPGKKSIRVFYQDGNHMLFYMYEQTDAFLRRCDDKDNWVGNLFSKRKFVTDAD